MDSDRATQAFLARIPEPVIREAERLRSAGAVKQIFGGQAFVRARIEDGEDVYRITLRREANGWESDITGPESSYPAAVAATMLERIARGESLPDSPNEVGDASLTELLENRLNRPLSPQEDLFVEKLEKRYRRYEMEQKLFDHDLVRLNPKWPVTGYDPLTLWPAPPRDIVEFWNYIAAAFEKKRLTYPPFLAAITRQEQTRAQMRDWERERERTQWQERIDRIVSRPQVTPRPIGFRILVTTRDARLQQTTASREGERTFETVSGEVELARIRQSVDDGLLVPDDLSGVILTQWAGHWESGDSPPPVLSLESAADRAFLGRLLRQPALEPRIVTFDEIPFYRAPDPLHWQCLETDGADSTDEDDPVESDADADSGSPADRGYALQLTMHDGEPVPFALTVLPGPVDLYISGEAVFAGPRPWIDSAEVMPRYDVPDGILESESGVDFLRRLGVALPPSLAARSVDAVLAPKFSLRLSRRGGVSDVEVVIAHVTASDPDGLRTEVLEKDVWRTSDSRRLDGGRLPWFDRSALFEVPDLLAGMGFAWDNPQKAFRARLTRTFPDRFVRWLDSLPAGVEVELDGDLQSLRADPVKASVRFEIEEAGDLDWFDLKVLVEVEGMDLSRQQIRELVEARGGFVRMTNGSWLRLALDLSPDQESAIGRLGLDVFDLSGETHRMHVLQLAEPAAGEIFDPAMWNRVCDRAGRLKLQVRPPVPEGFRLELRPYQIEGFHFLAYLASNGFGGILADDMGLGKTAQSICWILWLRRRSARAAGEEAAAAAGNGNGASGTAAPPRVPPSLVVAPKSVLDVWAGEVEKFAPLLRVQVVRDKSELDTARLDADIDLLVLNYSQLRVNAEKLTAVTWLTVILDEGQQIKNPDSLAARAARELQSSHRLVLSGTPIENRLLDVWSLMSFAMPGVLGNRKYFRERFDRRKDSSAHTRLSARLRPFLLRRTKSQVALDLPSRTEEDILSKLEDVQERMYADELQRMQRIVLGIDNETSLRRNNFAILQGLMRLRQICCHPALVDPKHADVPSAKMTALFYLLDQLRDSGHKVLVFSQFTSMLELIRARLEAEDRPHLLLTGQSKNRGELVQTFQSSKDPLVFLLSLKAGGSGLNLTAASYVTLYDPWWNPAVESQAIDRTHRIGQTNPVIAYRLLARNTVEEKIRRLQHQKQALVSGVLGDETFTRNLSLDDVRSLFARDTPPADD